VLALAASSRAAVVVDSFGFPGSQGGRLNLVIFSGIAINQSGAGGVAPGTLYVGDYNEGNAVGKDANRVQRLDFEGDFQLLWGLDVVQSGGTGFEICTVAVECKLGSTVDPAPGGQVHSPAGIAVDQTTGDVYVSDAGDTRIEKFSAGGSFLRAWGWDVVKPGGAGNVSADAFEICTVAADCKAGTASQSGGGFVFAKSIALDPSGNLWIADTDSRRLQEFEPDGTFVAAYGWDVVKNGGTGNVSENAFEVCTVEADCKAATEGTELGQFKSGPLGMTIDSAGFVYATDPGNDRIQKFSADMTIKTQFAPEILEKTGLSSLGQSVILALPGGGFALSGAASGGYRLVELDASGEVVEESLAGDGLPQISALAVNSASGTIYANVANAEVANNSPGVAIIDDGPAQAPPGLAIDPVTSIDAEEATFNATVDPGGLLVADCRFEYSTNQAVWKKVPESQCESLDRDGGPQQVSETVGDLEPGTDYFVHFKAGRYYYTGGGATSGEEEFETISLPPLVSDVGAAQITDHSAYLAGEVKPRSQSFEYHFEYGTTPALGSSIPVPTAQETGAQQRVVAQLIEGLAPETTYYLRLIATNAAGTTKSPPVPEPPAEFTTRPELEPIHPCKNEPLREEQPSTHLPECRAYEQVTPPEKNFTSPETGFPAADGEAAFLAASGGFGDPAGQIGEIATGYRSVRTKDGWRTRWHNETYCSKDLEETHFQPATGGSPSGYSENLDFLAVLRPEASVCPYPSLDPDAPTPQTNLYRADFREVAKEGPVAYELLAPNPGADELSLKQTGGRYAGSNDDWSHVVYTSNGVQSTGAPAGEFVKVYDWHDGEPHLVSKDTSTIPPGGNPFEKASGVPEDALHGVSAEGNRIFFMNPTSEFGDCTPANCEIYMRQNGTKTFDVSKSECTSSCSSSAPDEFLAATGDGAKVLFKGADKLLNEDTATGSDLYLYTHTSKPDSDANLTLLSKDQEPADGTSAGVLGLLGMSEDAEVAYFTAQGQLVAGKPTAAGAKLYRWAANEGSPTLTYLATLGSGSTDAGNWSGSGSNNTRGPVRAVPPDGKSLRVRSAVRIDPGADHDEDADLYRWSEQDGWLCISCQVPTSASKGDVELTVNNVPSHYLHAMSEDGGRVFFSTPDPLAPGDVNAGQPKNDVYEWREDGSLALVSSGADTRDVKLLGASTTGRDVFLITYKRLVGWDTDDSADVYDARVEGGFKEPVPHTICDPNSGCRGEPTSEPPAQRPATPAIEAPPSAPKKKKCHRRAGHTGKAKRHARQARQSRKKPKKPRCQRANKGKKKR
jgi:DNA-binding beta-propeller fold protein YncE